MLHILYLLQGVSRSRIRAVTVLLVEMSDIQKNSPLLKYHNLGLSCRDLQAFECVEAKPHPLFSNLQIGEEHALRQG